MEPDEPSSSNTELSADELALMVNQVWDPIITIDAAGEIKFFNGAAEDMFGYTASDVLGEDVHELLAPEDYLDDAREGMDIFRETGDGEILGGTRELIAKKRDGTSFPIELTVNAYQTDAGLFAVGVLRDISKRKELEYEAKKQRDWAEKYFELSGTLMVEIGMEGEIKRINKRGRDLLGYTEDELIGASWFDLVVPDGSYITLDDILENFDESTDGVEVHENKVRTKSGECRIMKWHNTLLRDEANRPVSILSAGADITERRRQEELLNQQNERLDEFASVISHDLRNPLNVADGRASLLAEEIDSPHTEPLLDALDRISDIIQDTLTLARDGEMVDDFEPIDLETIADESWEMVDTGDASLSVTSTQSIYGDRDRLKQLFENLFRNAVEHGGDTVTVEVGVLDSYGFYVEDDGEGIPEADRYSIFNPGFTSSEDGTGFGLSIVKRIVDAHEWRLRVYESDRGGARFEFRNVTFDHNTQ